ncbi:hypothetical protein MRX96_017223 [Rhipicephalus microplus]
MGGRFLGTYPPRFLYGCLVLSDQPLVCVPLSGKSIGVGCDDRSAFVFLGLTMTPRKATGRESDDVFEWLGTHSPSRVAFGRYRRPPTAHRTMLQL